MEFICNDEIRRTLTDKINNFNHPGCEVPSLKPIKICMFLETSKKGEFLKKAHMKPCRHLLSNGNALSPKSAYQNDSDSGFRQWRD
jgi:hypothetical protein